jgi:hypothetical protein
MHPAPMPKRHTPYGFFEVAEFLQTQMQNARRATRFGEPRKNVIL